MKTTGAYKIWRIVYPIGIYYVVSSLAYFFLTLLLGAGEESYMLRQMLCAAATIPFVWMHYGQDTVYGRRGIRPDARFFYTVAGSLLAGASLGMAVNNVIAMTPLIEASAGFQSANQAFFAGGVLFELLGSCLVIPLAEELLYRGVVERRLSLLCGSAPAIVLSAVIFGVMHWNVVQFLYAGILGLLLAWLLERTGFLYAPVLAHIGANVMAVVRSETGWLDIAYQPTAAGIAVTVLLFAVAAFAVLLVKKGGVRQEEEKTSAA
mgnify:CR=1 FL=1